MRTLRGAGAIVVGARRIGAVVARRLADEGVNLAIVYRASRAEAEALAAEVAPKVERVAVAQADAASEADAKRAVAEAEAALGRVDFVVNLASDYPRDPLDALDAGAWERAMADARAAFLLSVHASRAMARNPGPTRGHIVQFGDWAAGRTPYRGYLPYLTAKAAVHFMTRAFAVELAPQGILVNAVLPGPTMRPPDIAAEEWEARLARDVPLGRESSADEIAEVVVTLLRSETITGELIHVDSGLHVAGNGAAR